MQNFNYGIIAVDLKTCEFLHAVGFENEPGVIDWMHLYKELHEDEELGCIGHDFILVPAPADALKKMNEILHDPETTIVNKVE